MGVLIIKNKSTGCTDGHSCMQFVTMMKCDVNANYFSQRTESKLAWLEISDGAVSWNMHITSLWWKLPEELNWEGWRWMQVHRVKSWKYRLQSSVTAHRPLNYLHLLFMCDIRCTPAVTELQITVERCVYTSVATNQVTLTPSVILLGFVLC